MELQAFIDEALREDVGSGDHTSLSTIPAGKSGNARLLVKEDGILAGVAIAEMIFATVDPALQVSIKLKDAAVIKKGDIVLTVTGSVRSILKAERLVLNCMQRMSGIATTTSVYVKEVEGCNVHVLDTRKTTPLMRILEKSAVRIGGGMNHRFGLFDMILIKDNHVDSAGSITAALQMAAEYLKAHQLSLPIEIETRTLDEVREAVNARIANRIMLDNFTPELIHEALRLIPSAIETEASGGITLTNIRKYAETGVKFISVGALTHSVKSLDLSLKIY
jgi:nicotinate-nucleotide pyrophosphorylase (carboxylating)